MPFRSFLPPVLFSAALLLATALQAQPRTPPSKPTASTPSASATFTNSALDGELFYQLLLSELNAIQGLGGSVGNSYSLMLDAARKANDASLFQRAVDMAIQARAGEPALQAARAWKSAQPQSREANWQVLQVLLALNRLPETAEPLRTQIQLTPSIERNGAIAQIPRLYARASDKKAAAALVEQSLTEAAAAPPTAAASWTAIGRLRLAAADAAGAVQAASRAQAAEAGNLGAAQLALEIMDPKHPDAEPLVRRYLDTAAATPELRLGYARALMDAQRFGEASAQVQRVTRDRPNLAEAWGTLGALELQENQLDKADASLKKYIELITPTRNSDDKQRGLTQAYLSLAQIAEKRRDFALAESWLAKIDSPQALVSTQNRRASLLAKQGRMAEARALIAKLPERAGAEGAADRRTKAIAEAQLLKDAKDFTGAYEVLQAAAERAPQDHELIYQQANAAEKLKRHGEMERLLRRAIEIKPDFAYAYNFLGYSMADRNVRLPEAKTLLQKAMELAPGDPAITDSLGWVEFRLGNVQEAIRLLETAYKAFPNAEIGAHLAEVLWVTGQRDRATAILKECLLLDKEDEVLQETIRRLRVRL
ncbi:MAG: tetratricopeptide repeat protein [Brachymonas sp.]